MRLVLAYWVIGCVLMGISLGAWRDRCPHDPATWQDVVFGVAVWPAAIAEAMVTHRGMPACDKLSGEPQT